MEITLAEEIAALISSSSPTVIPYSIYVCSFHSHTTIASGLTLVKSYATENRYADFLPLKILLTAMISLHK